MKMFGKLIKVVEVKQKEVLIRKQEKNRNKKMQVVVEEESKLIELLQKFRDYIVKFYFLNLILLNFFILGFNNVNFVYGNNFFLFVNLDFGIDMSFRVVIVGLNGVGKLIFLKFFVGDLEFQIGEMIKNYRLRIGKYDQYFVDQLNMDEISCEYL